MFSSSAFARQKWTKIVGWCFQVTVCLHLMLSYQQWMPVLCVGGDTLDYSTIPCFSMNTALTENVTDTFHCFSSNLQKANSTRKQWLSYKCKSHISSLSFLLPVLTSSSPWFTPEHALIIQFSSPPLPVCVPPFLSFLLCLFNYHGNRWCGSSHRDVSYWE